MAIIIPSKRIYSIKNNKIIDNKIEKIEIKMNNVTPIIDTDKALEGTTFDITGQGSIFRPSPEDYAFVPEYNQHHYEYSYVYFRNEYNYYENVIYVPKKQGNSNIDSISKVEFSVLGKLTKGKTSAIITATEQFGSSSYEVKAQRGEIQTTDLVKTTEKFKFPEMPEVVSATNNISFVTVSVNGISDESSYTVQESSDGEGFNISFKVLTKYMKTTLTGTGGLNFEGQPIDFPVSGIYEDYDPQQLQVVAYANITGIQLNEVNQYEGNINKDATYSIDNNELLQTTNYYLFKDSSFETDVPYKDYHLEQIINQYKNGKETVTLTCSINDYYDENGNKVIDTKKSNNMMFKEFDEVIPYTFTSKGTDKPISVTKTGTPKRSIVIGVRPFYNGAVWQELYLLEKE